MKAPCEQPISMIGKRASSAIENKRISFPMNDVDLFWLMLLLARIITRRWRTIADQISSRHPIVHWGNPLQTGSASILLRSLIRNCIQGYLLVYLYTSFKTVQRDRQGNAAWRLHAICYISLCPAKAFFMSGRVAVSFCSCT